MQLGLLEKLYGLDDGKNNDNQVITVADIIGEIADMLIPLDEEEESSTGETSTLSDDEDDEDDDDEEENVHSSDACFSTNEMLGMAKKKTIYVYRNEKQVDEAISAKKPLAGIVEVTKSNGKTAFEFQIVFRKPVKQFACRRVEFDDADGVLFHGMWCSPMAVKEEIVQTTESFAEIQSLAKLAAVAIPLWYVIGKGHPNSNKYCVITNWWKYRMSDGWYRLPTLDASLYGTAFQTNTEWEDESDDETAATTDRKSTRLNSSHLA